MKRITLRDVNSKLAAAGHPERLVRGDGYFYFVGGAAMRWPSASVMVPRLNVLTLDQWFAEFLSLKGGAR